MRVRGIQRFTLNEKEAVYGKKYSHEYHYCSRGQLELARFKVHLFWGGVRYLRKETHAKGVDISLFKQTKIANMLLSSMGYEGLITNAPIIIDEAHDCVEFSALILRLPEPMKIYNIEGFCLSLLRNRNFKLPINFTSREIGAKDRNREVAAESSHRAS